MADDAEPPVDKPETVDDELDLLPAPDMEAVLAALEGEAAKECWVCGERDWSLPPGTNLIAGGLDPDGRIDMGLGFSAVALICKNCGLVRFHHIGRLLG